MIDATYGAGAAAIPYGHDTDHALHARIRAEYLEMPGMRLTLMQAARLFNLEQTQCAQVLNALVTSGALWTDGREFLGRNVGRRFA